MNKPLWKTDTGDRDNWDIGVEKHYTLKNWIADIALLAGWTLTIGLLWIVLS